MTAWFICPFIANLLARRKKRDYNFWTIASFLFPPLMLILFILPRRSTEPRKMFGDESELDDNFFPNKD